MMITLEQIRQAAATLSPVIRRTELLTTYSINPNAQIYLKPECLQETGSFKVRGAYYKMSTLTDQEKQRGVVACSAGNHAQGVALGAAHAGIPALICLPKGAPISKVEATKRLGAKVELVPGVYDDAYHRALALRDEGGYTFVHPFNDLAVITGQATIGLEIYEQMPDVEAVVVPVGGGGLISGIAMALKQLNPKIKIYGVQSTGAPSMALSLNNGRVERLPYVNTIADGIAVKEPGDLTFKLCQQYVDDIVTVTDDEVATAILNLIEQQKMVAEGAGAVAVAAAMFRKLPLDGKKAVCLVSGGNIDVNILSRVITRGLIEMGRSCVLTIELPDKPGQLQGVTEIIARAGSNVISIYHERSGHSMPVTGCYLRLVLETRNEAHIQEIKDTLSQAGYNLVNGYNI